MLLELCRFVEVIVALDPCSFFFRLLSNCRLLSSCSSSAVLSAGLASFLQTNVKQFKLQYGSLLHKISDACPQKFTVLQVIVTDIGNPELNE